MNHSTELIYQVPGYNRTKKKRHSESMSKKICGFICNAGTDFIELVNQHDTKLMIMKEKISHIEFADCDCSMFHAGWYVEDDHECNECRTHECECDSDCTCQSDCHHHSCYRSGIPVCDDRIQLRLAGLDDNLNFKFFMLKGCKVCIEFKE